MSEVEKIVSDLKVKRTQIKNWKKFNKKRLKVVFEDIFSLFVDLYNTIQIVDELPEIVEDTLEKIQAFFKEEDEPLDEETATEVRKIYC